MGKKLCFLIITIVVSFLAYPFFVNPEVPIKIKILDMGFSIGRYYSGLGTDNFSRTRYNQLKNLVNLFKKHSPSTFIEELTVPSLLNDGHQIEVKIYINKTFLTSSNKKLPSIIYIHGGGWVFDYPTMTFYEQITSKGIAFIEIHYRMAPENKFPIPLEDCYSAINSELIYKYSDKTRIALLGDSAGANLVSALILLLKDRNNPILENIKSQILFYPATLTLNALPSHKQYENWYFLSGELMKYYRKAYARTEQDYENPYFNPTKSENLTGFPETLLILSRRDYLFSEGEEFGEILKSAGNSVDIKIYDIEHAFLVLEVEESELALRDTVDFLKKKKFF